MCCVSIQFLVVAIAVFYCSVNRQNIPCISCMSRKHQVKMWSREPWLLRDYDFDWKIRDEFHSIKNSGLNFRDFRMSNGTVFTTRPDGSRLSIPALTHFPPRFHTQQNADHEGSRWSGCLKGSKLFHTKNNLTRIHDHFRQTLPWYFPDRFKDLFVRETCELFSRGIV